MAYSINWRDVQPKIAHLSAVHWGGLRDKQRDDDPDGRNRLLALGALLVMRYRVERRPIITSTKT